MKVTGGSYGQEALVTIEGDKGLMVEHGDSEKVIYSPGQILSATVEELKERTFDRTAYLVGFVPSVILCASILGWYGILAGAVLAIPCGYWAGRDSVVIIHFDDERFIRAELAPDEMYELKEMRKPS